MTEQTRELIEYLGHEAFRSPGHCRLYFDRFFGDVEVRGKNVLEIGAGLGWLALYASCAGAKHVVALEPEAAGSTSGNLEKLRRTISRFQLERRISVLPQTIQEFEPEGESFDLVVSRSSINHLDEEACVSLERSREAREIYFRIFRKIRSVMNFGGSIIITDSSRYNVFATLGLKNPLAPTIEWRLHQSPRYWAHLLEGCGFVNPRITWQLPGPLRPVESSRIARVLAYLTTSRFRLVMRAGSPTPRPDA